MHHIDQRPIGNRRVSSERSANGLIADSDNSRKGTIGNSPPFHGFMDTRQNRQKGIVLPGQAAMGL
jgi:hypothetical protein